MKFKVKIFLVISILTSCGQNNSEIRISDSESSIDTLVAKYANPHLGQPIKETFLINGVKVNTLRINDTIDIKISFSNEYAEILKKSNFKIRPYSESEAVFYTIKKINNNHFKLFIQNDYPSSGIAFYYNFETDKNLFKKMQIEQGDTTYTYDHEACVLKRAFEVKSK